MSDIDKQRIAAVHLLKMQGFTWTDGNWRAPYCDPPIRWYRQAGGDDFDAAPPCPETDDGKHKLDLTGTWCFVCGLRGMIGPDGKVPGGKG